MGFSAITLGFCRPQVTVNAVQFKKGLRVSLYLYVYIYIYIYIRTPKWMVYNGKLSIKMDDLGVILF